MKKRYRFLSSAWLVAMLLWASVANAQNQDDFFSKVVELLNEMSDEEKVYVRENMYGETANGVELYHQDSFPYKYEGGAFPRCFKTFFEELHKGYTTEYYTGTTDDLKDAVSQGIPVIALLLYNRKSMHYVPVVGYDESHFFIQNSVEKYRNVKDNPSYNESLPIDQFDAM